MIEVRKASDRGHTQNDWLDSYHSFAFGRYVDPERMGFRSLRVINEDVFAPLRGFGMHPHDNMEILTYVLSGQLRHEDSLGHSGVLHAGQWQRMTAGTGIMHSESNPSAHEPVHFYQIWISPNQRDLSPGYAQLPARDPAKNRWSLIAASESAGGLLTIHQDARLYQAVLEPPAILELPIEPGYGVWVQVVSGVFDVNGFYVERSDGAAIEAEAELRVSAVESGSVLVFVLA
jgi:redox-sensitive bicupin YhaK (pirin superfamily)